jgi:glutaredoxin-like YruB-family protein
MLSKMKTVTIYSTPTCTYCNAAKDFFKENGVEFQVHDVAVDTAKRQEMIEKSGQMGVPVIIINEELVVGFDKARLSELLDIKE